MDIIAKHHIKSLILICFAAIHGFASDAIDTSDVDTITTHHTERRNLANADLIRNQSKIKTESDSITDILSKPNKVDIKRHATVEERTQILSAVLGERLLAQKMIHNGAEDFPMPDNHYRVIREKLEQTASTNIEDAAKRNHYRVLELTCDLGDILGCAVIKQIEDQRAGQLSAELSSLTGMKLTDISILIETQFYFHNIAMGIKESRNALKGTINCKNKELEIILNSIAGKSEADKMRSYIIEEAHKKVTTIYDADSAFRKKGRDGIFNPTEALTLINQYVELIEEDSSRGIKLTFTSLKRDIQRYLPNKADEFIALFKQKKGDPEFDHNQAQDLLALLQIDAEKNEKILIEYENAFNEYYTSIEGKTFIQNATNNPRSLTEKVNAFLESKEFSDLVKKAIAENNFEIIFDTEILRLIEQAYPKDHYKNIYFKSIYFNAAQYAYTAAFRQPTVVPSYQSYNYSYTNNNGVVTESSSGTIPPELQKINAPLQSFLRNGSLDMNGMISALGGTFQFH